MIELSRINGEIIFINIDLIEIVEETPNTVIKLTNGNKYIVRESGKEIINKIIAFKQKVKKLL
ncbi:flagellar FlbD family protein [Senegalia massiliensis]|uniref:Flagellar protein FlbD n=1 Tax=Senegalia massiliensis TaxID=1720316 RepID=A0A845R5T1_9CLOT|nr:flagellar FlbD family protein [Senegalia massiliensis]NBI07863.1 flagellar protein FlbD [Senegalia massiliensis]